MDDGQLQTASSRLGDLPRRLEQHPGFAAALAALQQGHQAGFDGVVGSSCALLVAALLPHCPGPLVVVCPNQDAADRLDDDARLFAGGTSLTFPPWESAPDERDIHDQIYGERLGTLKRLHAWDGRPAAAAGLDRLVVTSMPSLLQTVPDRATIDDSTRLLAVGAMLDSQEMRQWLVAQGFHATTAVELPGEFSARGGILDIFAADWEQPVRLELFGDEIESIRRFEVSTQRSVGELREVEVTVLRPGAGTAALLMDHLPPGSWFLLVEPEQCAVEASRHYERQEAMGGLLGPSEIQQAMLKFPLATASQIATATLPAGCRLQIESVERFSGEISRVREELDRSSTDSQVYIVARTDAELERLSEIFRDTHIAADQRLLLTTGNLSQGFRLVRDRVILVSGAELFHRGELLRTPRRRLGKAIDSFLDLHPGDLVVHLAHGIGRYRGMEVLERNGRVEEHLKLEFRGGTSIFVPAARIDLIQKYVGGTKSRPTLARLGAKTWLRQKAAAESAVVDLAAEMLEMQAARQSRPGIAFPRDSDWQREFDTAFPYRETPDQLSAIEAIKVDMLAPRPMDRLLCGDVGFGKTEVAMRAAFKSVDSGYQVAVLVPTTILAEQHYRTFQQRMAEFPFDIARLSRFCSAAQQRQILEGLARGRIDIVIGTHRLVSEDVQFLNLGLVVIDEEQRFGVEVKERLKKLRSTVDVVTMTATPIPRTLHMSLVGVRDISNLETPPENRLAVETRVTRFDPQIIRHAVLRELNRCGQIFFVHNRVEDIEAVAQRLRSIVPEASIRIGHGQMAESELESVMVDFVDQKFDILLATTIIESGLDIPNANTIFIDEAHRYGLADLHQLRGRVGRYTRRAHCYLLVDPRAALTPNATRRLRAIEEFSDMGAGFAIAMRDLEIRGAGNLLGTQQSGHIATVGYELYCQLLEQAVRRLKDLPPPVSLDVEINLPGRALLPTDYVPDLRFKIDLYRRMTRITNSAELEELRQELIDRFGPPPPPAERLLDLAALRIDAARWKIRAVYVEDQYLVFRFAHRPSMEQLRRQSEGRLRIVDDESAYLPAAKEVRDATKILLRAKSVLRPVSQGDYNPAPRQAVGSRSRSR